MKAAKRIKDEIETMLIPIEDVKVLSEIWRFVKVKKKKSEFEEKASQGIEK